MRLEIDANTEKELAASILQGMEAFIETDSETELMVYAKGASAPLKLNSEFSASNYGITKEQLSKFWLYGRRGAITTIIDVWRKCKKETLPIQILLHQSRHLLSLPNDLKNEAKTNPPKTVSNISNSKITKNSDCIHFGRRLIPLNYPVERVWHECAIGKLTNQNIEDKKPGIVCPCDCGKCSSRLMEHEVEACLEDIRKAPIPRKLDWFHNPVVRHCHKELAESHLKWLPEFDNREGEGIVLCGGGRYAVGNWLCIQMLRLHGYTGLIQLWHRGDDEPIPERLKSLWNVEIVNAYQHPKYPEWRILGGWQLKMIAILNCGWRKVLFFDADSYPVSNINPLFDMLDETPALYTVDINNSVEEIIITPEWHKINPKNKSRLNWHSYGLPEDPEISINGGFYGFDLKNTWKLVNLAHFFDMHSDYYYRYDIGIGGYGDQGQVWAATKWTQTPYKKLNREARWEGGVCVQLWPNGEPFQVHRISSKPGYQEDFPGNSFKTLGHLPQEGVVQKLHREYLCGDLTLESAILEVQNTEYKKHDYKWLRNPMIQQAHLELARRHVSSILEYKDREGEGIVLCGGGKYELGNWLCVQMLRYNGYTGKIQVWHRDDERIVGPLRDQWNVEIRNVKDYGPFRSLVSYEIKSIAILNSGWQKVLFFDADSYPVCNIDCLFDMLDETPALYVTDIDYSSPPIIWDSYGLPNQSTKHINGGFYAFNLARSWILVNLWHYFDMHSDFWYSVEHGCGGFSEQAQIWAATKILNAEYRILYPDCSWQDFIMQQKLPNGQVFQVHRIGSKPGYADDFPTQVMKPINWLPQEKIVQEFYQQYLAEYPRIQYSNL